MNIYEKLSIIQRELIAPKNQYNAFGKYHYRSCEDILEGLKPYLKKTKTAVTVSDEVVMIGDRYYIKATARLHDCESESAVCVENTAFAREEDVKKGMDGSQITGSSSSYARKYALNGLFCIDDVKDADTRDNRLKEAEQQKKDEEQQKKIENSVISELKLQALLARCESDSVKPATIQKLYKVNSLADLTERKFQNIHEHWEDIKNEQKK